VTSHTFFLCRIGSSLCVQKYKGGKLQVATSIRGTHARSNLCTPCWRHSHWHQESHQERRGTLRAHTNIAEQQSGVGILQANEGWATRNSMLQAGLGRQYSVNIVDGASVVVQYSTVVQYSMLLSTFPVPHCFCIMIMISFPCSIADIRCRLSANPLYTPAATPPPHAKPSKSARFGRGPT
jgi:hypothetical protein